MNSAERRSAPQGANYHRKTARRIASTVALTSTLLFAGAACTDSGEKSQATTTTEAAAPQPEQQGQATEKLKNETRPDLSTAFDVLLSDEACTDVVVLENKGSWNSPYESTEILAAKGNTFLELSRQINVETGEVSRLFAQFYVPGSALSPAERDALRSSDNPDGNRYGNSVQVFVVAGQDSLRIDANGHDEQGIFSTQGDIWHEEDGDYGYMGKPMEAAARAQRVVEEVADFMNVASCTANDPNVVV